MSELSEIILKWTWWTAGVISGLTVLYEYYTCSNKYQDKITKKMEKWVL